MTWDRSRQLILKILRQIIFKMTALPSVARNLAYDNVLSDLNPTREEVDKTPIAQVLRDLREALVAAGTTYDYSQTPPVERSPVPCFTDYDPKKPTAASGNTYTLGLSIVNDLTGGISISVAVLSIGVTGEAKSTTGNTLTVSFSQPGLDKVQEAQDAVDADCASTQKVGRMLAQRQKNTVPM
jgi:hypothetical protein